MKIKNKIRKFIHTVKQKINTFVIMLKVNTSSTREILVDNRGASALEIALASIIAVVLALKILDAFTGIFSNTVIPKISSSITGMFS